MKKIIIGIAALGVMSFTTNQLYYSTQLVYAMENIENVKSWIEEDLNSGTMDKDVAEIYIEVLDETHGFISDYHNRYCK